jgi:hypothetical protein
MKQTYSVESFSLGCWRKLFTDTRDFCSGYLSHAQYDYPRNALRIVRGDGKVMYELKANEEVNVGMVASYPTAEQYERAAKLALEKAAHIRAQEAKQEERRLHRITIPSN